MNTVIVTCDLDILQMVNDSVIIEVFSQCHAMRVFDVQKTIKRFENLKPSKIAHCRPLAGDKSYNLLGVPAICDVVATALLTKKAKFVGYLQVPVL
jgi:5'-3' exonuclease